MTALDRLRQHLHATELGGAIRSDAYILYQVKVLEHYLLVLDAALTDAVNDGELYNQAKTLIIDKVIYGCTPHEPDAMLRAQQHDTITELLSTPPWSVHPKTPGQPT